MSNKSQDIQGNLNISRNLTIGSHGNIEGDLVIGHHLKVKGWVDAPHIKGPLKGLYKDEESLRKAYPLPMPGWFALVGDTLPADVWRSEGGKWVKTGEKGGEFSLWLDGLEEDVRLLWDFTKDTGENLEQLRKEFDTLVSGDASKAIDNFNEIVKFLEGIEDSETLVGKLAELKLECDNNKKELQGNIDAEARTRAEADKTLQGNINAEAETRKKADDELDNRIDAVEERISPIIYCKGFLNLGQSPSADGSYLQRDSDGDPVQIAIKSGWSLRRVLPEEGIIYSCEGKAYVFNGIMLVPSGHTYFIFDGGKADTQDYCYGESIGGGSAATDMTIAKRINCGGARFV